MKAGYGHGHSIDFIKSKEISSQKKGTITPEKGSISFKEHISSGTKSGVAAICPLGSAASH